MKDSYLTLPIVALRGMTVLPGMLIHFDINREITIEAVKKAMDEDQRIFVVAQTDESIQEPDEMHLYRMGTISTIKQLVKLSDKVMRVMISSTERASLLEVIQQKPYLLGTICPVDEEEDEKINSFEKEAMMRAVKDLFELYCIENPRIGNGVLQKIMEEKSFGQLIDLIAMQIAITVEQKQKVLECISLYDRYEMVSINLSHEIEILRLKKAFGEKVKQHVDKNQRDYLLREQMKVIQEELGETDLVSEADKFLKKCDDLIASEEIKSKIREEIRRFKSISGHSSESAVVRGYIETLLTLPWDYMSRDQNNLKQAMKILDADHYGLEKVKERILEFLAVRELTGKGESPIMCLVGPPGTGKTSIARSVAKALKKEYVRISLGGVHDEAEIRGHRRTYVGAMPGRLIASLKQAKVKNPLILLDEVDKVSRDHKGDTASALLEVLDSEQNSKFVDHYVEIPVDLSEVLFLCTANTTDTLPKPLLDRMEIINISGYTANEKFHIAKEHLLQKQISRNGLSNKQLKISDKAITDIISFYTREAGVRNLERKIASICRKAAREIVSKDKEQIRVSAKNLTDYLGKKIYRYDIANEIDEIGVVRGLAWTSVGGDTLEVEVNVMHGKGECEITGQLGDVMKESAVIALNYVRSISDEYGISKTFYEEHDMHIHVPEGAVPKDGPSAGITMATAILSAVTKIKARADVAMTGEVTLRGKVLPIGGLKEKILAAKMANIKTVLIPFENQKDLEELEDEILEGLDIHLVKTMKDVIAYTLLP